MLNGTQQQLLRCENRRYLFSTLEDLNFADDLTHTSISKTRPTDCKLRIAGGALQISTKKTETMISNVDIPAPVKVNGEEVCKCILKLYFN